MTKVKIISLLLLAMGIFYFSWMIYLPFIFSMLIYLLFKRREKEIVKVLKDLFFFLLMVAPYLILRLFFTREGREYVFGPIILYGEGLKLVVDRLYHLISLYFLTSLWFKIFPIDFKDGKNLSFFESFFLSIKWFPLLLEDISFGKKGKSLKKWGEWIDLEYTQSLKNSDVVFRDESRSE